MKITDLVKSPQLYVGLSTGAAAAVGISVIPGVLPILAGAAAIVGFAGGLIGSSFERKPKDEVEIVEVDILATLPDDLKGQVLRLKKIARLHAQAETPVFELINSILLNSQELFQRITSKMDSQAHRLAAVNYTDTLSKLNRALDTDYYLDIKKNPRLWDSPENRLSAVEKAVEATEKQLVRNIRQVNASQDIDYEVSLESLTSSMDSVSASDLTN